MEDVINVFSLKMVREKDIEYGVGGQKIFSAARAHELIEKVFDMGNLPEEVLVLICMDTKNQIVSMSKVSQGSLNASIVHPREIFKRAVLSNANTIMLAHNHPSGNTEPSREDKDITRRVKEAGELMGIALLDHLIIGGPRYLSFKEERFL